MMISGGAPRIANGAGSALVPTIASDSGGLNVRAMRARPGDAR